ncbi:hypothetical protein LR48_Vigan1020s000100 [Vigna angularis]|uniref:Uncharacterized protein n=1 Tax=Phaseolus angularis TaxID=3914 RepID=A0A0L9TI95_PHAAN|nr:hypothetical protein LR48_Vigan1020s000100 [Vigna angularis]
MEVVLEEDDSNNDELLWLLTAVICNEEVAIRGGLSLGSGVDSAFCSPVFSTSGGSSTYQILRPSSPSISENTLLFSNG